MNVKQVWFCPSCQKHHAPHVETCPGVVDTLPNPNQPYMPVTLPYRPFEPRYLTGTHDPCAACKGGACGNAACPKRWYLKNGAGCHGAAH